MGKVKSLTSNKKNLLKIFLIALVLIALPLTLILVRQTQDQRSEASYDAPAYIEEGGRVVIEAETYDDYQTNGTSYNWTKKDDGKYPEYPTITLYYMQSLPNDDATLFNAAPSPELKYNIWITNPGTYYAFIRSSAPGPNADSIHVGIDGGQKTNMGTYYEGKYGYQSTWDWEGNGGPVALNISTPGLHTFNIWARETGAKIDRINLTKDKNWSPGNHSNRGPGASPRSTVTVGSPTPIPCVQQAPLVEVIGDSSKDVLPNESVDYTLKVTNQNSANCGSADFSLNNSFNPNTTEISWNASENSFALNPGQSKDITISYTPSDAATGQNFAATIRVSETGSSYSSTATLNINVIQLTTLEFNRVILHGIGIGGDNANPTGLGNQDPITTTKSLRVRVYDSGGNLITEENGDITYGTGGFYSGSIIVGTPLASGDYIIKVKTHKYLVSQVAGIITINGGEVNSMPEVTLIAGDINSDEVTTLEDYDILIGCYADLLPAIDCDSTRKFNSDLTDDGFVNADDYNFLLREWSNQPGA